jgi:hypothetical protein
MKRLYSVFLAAILLFAAATCSLGAIHNIGGDFYLYGELFSWLVDDLAPRSIDSWFSIAPEKVKFKAFGTAIDSDWGGIAAEYYLNDQTFASVASFSDDSNNSFYLLKGMYLFDFGLFLGLENSQDDDAAQTFFTLGYRFSFGDDNYLALSADYLDETDGDSAIFGYEISGRYYTDMMKFYGLIYAFNNDDSDLFYLLGANFLISDSFIIGLELINNGSSSNYLAGFSWTLERFILDFEYGNNDNDESYYELGGMFLINEVFGIGLGYLDDSEIDDAQLSAKFKYVTDSSEFTFVFKPENDTYTQEYNLTYTMYL